MVKVGLEVVQDVLDTGVHLQLDVVVEDEGVVELEVKVEEVGSGLHAVFGYVACVVGDNHVACVGA